MSEATDSEKAEWARERITSGLEYLCDEDGYSRDDLQEFVNGIISELYEEQS